MNEFAQNSTSMPAYRKKYDKLYEQVKANEASQIKNYISRFENHLAGK